MTHAFFVICCATALISSSDLPRMEGRAVSVNCCELVENVLMNASLTRRRMRFLCTAFLATDLGTMILSSGFVAGTARTTNSSVLITFTLTNVFFLCFYAVKLLSFHFWSACALKNHGSSFASSFLAYRALFSYTYSIKFWTLSQRKNYKSTHGNFMNTLSTSWCIYSSVY